MLCSFNKLISGDHLFSIHDNDNDALDAALAFITAGLQQGERCIFITDKESQKIRETLKKREVNSNLLATPDSLTILNENRDLKIEQLFDLLHRGMDNKRNQEHSLTRIAVDLAVLFDNKSSSARLSDYEMNVERCINQHSCIVMCQGNRRKFTASQLLLMIRLHKLIEYHGNIRFNLHFSSPAMLDQITGDEDRLKNILALCERQTVGIEHYQDLLSSVPIGIFRSTPEGKLISINDAMLRIYGCGSRRELLGKSAQDFYDDPGRREELLERLQTERIVNNFITKEWKIDGTPIFVLSNYYLTSDDKNNILYIDGTVQDVTERISLLEKLEQRVRFEKVIAQISSQFLSEKNINRAINTSLSDLGKFSGADRAYVFRFDDQRELMNNTHEWCAKGVSPQIENLQELPLDTFPWWMENLRQDRIIHIPDVSKMAAEAVAEQQILESQDIRSVLVLPLKINNRLAGFVGFDNVQKTGNWHEQHLGLLEIYTQQLGSAFDRFYMYKAMRESKEKFQALFDQSTEAIFILDHESPDIPCKIIDLNHQALLQTGYEREELIGKSVHMLNPTGCELIDQNIEEQILAEQQVLIETVHQRKEGFQFPVEIMANLIKVGDKQFILFVARDITERKEQNRQLLMANERLQYLLYSSSVVIYTVRLEKPYPVSFISESVYRLLGYLADEILETPEFWIEHIHPDDLPSARRGIRNIVAHKHEERTFEYRIRKKDGAYIWVYDSIRVIKDPGGNESEGIGYLVDITDRKRAQEALKRETALLQTLFDTLPESIYIKDREQCYLRVNRQKAALHNTTPEKMIGKTNFDYFDAEIARQLTEDDKSVLNTGQPIVNREGKLKYEDGQTYWESVTKLPWRDPKQNIAGTIGIIRDITDLKKAQEELIQVQKMDSIGRLAGGVAHDFNNLLTVIRGRAQIALMEKKSPAKLEKELNHILNTADRATKLTRQLLLFSRKQKAVLQTINLNRTIANFLKILKRLIGENIIVKTDLDEKLALIRADVGNIEQLITNLAVNARDAMPEGGELRIKTENITIDEQYVQKIRYSYPGDFVRLTIEDTGHGIKSELVDEIFEPFFTTKAPEKGTGMGLSVVYGIVKKHKGWINVYSETGQGTSFKVYFPITKRPVDREVEQEKVAQRQLAGNGERILVVEDEDEVLDFLCYILSENGYSVFKACNGQEALELFKKEEGDFNLIMSDFIMPGINGLELARLLTADQPNIEVIISSGYTEDKVNRDLIRKNGYAFINKPYDVQKVLKKIKEVLEK